MWDIVIVIFISPTNFNVGGYVYVTIFIMSFTSGSTPILLLEGRWGSDPSGDLSTVVKQILYS